MAGIAAAASAGVAGGIGGKMKSALAGGVRAKADVAAAFTTVSCAPSAARVGARQLDHLLRNGRTAAPPLLFSPFSPPTCVRESSHKKAPRSRLLVRAAKLPAGVEPPSESPRLSQNLIGFTEDAEVLNSRAAMIGFFGLLAVEFIANKPILEMLGVEIGKGLNLPF
ncbi:hypothetical protein CBR_g4596 [Chara braunii]|uniref:Uncharacterized protein n=1 Tax=Chara braunii TaxID=69332 RepID=A0A388KI90_CHABU|nr:hypothetical protein CBR_g4596 [Chara braunii]|eukprot:GBG69765.1 hypothetical protein CBR_g4596 [Chara braunii]